MSGDLHEIIFARCQAELPGWGHLTVDDVVIDRPKGFSSVTAAVRLRPGVSADPPGVFYRHLDGKENAILHGGLEREVFLAFGARGIAARCLAYGEGYRLEALYTGRTLTPEDLRDEETLAAIAGQLHRLHRTRVPGLPARPFFEMVPERWGPLAARALADPAVFPEEERALCGELRGILDEETTRQVRALLPADGHCLCHNDTYHGNIMRLANGEVRLLDFEFSCRSHPAFDFANLFAETVMEHGLPEPPHFRIAAPRFGAEDVARLVGPYLALEEHLSAGEREDRLQTLVRQTMDAIPLSDYMYALAAIHLAPRPIQRIRFLPYAHQRFGRFRAAVAAGARI